VVESLKNRSITIWSKTQMFHDEFIFLSV